ncbi:hypothetical protein BU23DRAFT_602126 [Bimuria novae-zelandiae CBS 107.79]|uniref:DUF7587 domain-containing protein n=1 Tax=Bimuria novae-zelandiae CBS 107.79 TaxID=1447943 RepID=A0A6A5V5C1_9PLEO|nr:hypothetical protein BU23DRAFT_602126 [Bimuria novae-zelandiae CBS 107.79]
MGSELTIDSHLDPRPDDGPRKALPRYFYRVQHDACATRYEPSSSELGRRGYPTFTSVRMQDHLAEPCVQTGNYIPRKSFTADDLSKDVIEKHFHWNSLYRSPFISFYSEEGNALKRAEYELHAPVLENGVREVHVAKIDTDKLNLTPAWFLVELESPKRDEHGNLCPQKYRRIPAWVWSRKLPAPGGEDRLFELNTDEKNTVTDVSANMWICLSEVKDLLGIKYDSSDHDGEWLAYRAVGSEALLSVRTYIGKNPNPTNGLGTLCPPIDELARRVTSLETLKVCTEHDAKTATVTDRRKLLGTLEDLLLRVEALEAQMPKQSTVLEDTAKILESIKLVEEKVCGTDKNKAEDP